MDGVVPAKARPASRRSRSEPCPGSTAVVEEPKKLAPLASELKAIFAKLDQEQAPKKTSQLRPDAPVFHPQAAGQSHQTTQVNMYLYIYIYMHINMCGDSYTYICTYMYIYRYRYVIQDICKYLNRYGVI